MPRASIGDAEIYYEESGQGEPLLLVPGLSGVGSFWAPQVAELRRDFRVVIHDHRGTGQSTHSRITYSVEQMAGDVLKLWTRSRSTPRTSSATPPVAPLARSWRSSIRGGSRAWCCRR